MNPCYELHVGCAQWNHKSWQPQLPPGERLEAYATWCNAVEGNTTFYAVPARETVESWARQTDPGFRLLAKLPKSITHLRHLQGPPEELRQFLHTMEPLGPRLHALWIQLPAGFGPADLGTLAAFLRTLPTGHRYAVEVRHRAFFDDARAVAGLEKVLATRQAEWVPFDTTVLFERPPTSDAERDAWTRKPRMPRRDRALTSHPLIRYIGRDDADRTVEGWAFWIEKTVEWLKEGRSPTMFVHTPDNTQALTLAHRFHQEVRAKLPDLEPLPDPPEVEPLTLF
ncbi:DUF72 domain-containing protein [Herbidospora cretacea]|uniref:DUF72 domain-containing protein n=1 Tax=Herbidospora cretacea TaxID=28444 RepID=UPI0007745DC8|nr:DUF72 domain-containing protein [Herbidospora cretacea]